MARKRKIAPQLVRQTPVRTKRDTKNQQEIAPQSLGFSKLPPGAIMNNVTIAPQGTLPVQTKLTIGEVGDKYEQEADRVASDVVRQLHEPSVRQEGQEEDIQKKPTLQGQETLGAGEAPIALEAEIDRARSGGQPLDGKLQRSMSQAMGTDFSHVKVHTDNTSHQLNQSLQAKAFTTGRDIFFRQGQYNPNSKGGQELIAHELTHVVQQNGASVQRKSMDTVVQCIRERSGEQGRGQQGLSSMSDRLVERRINELLQKEIAGTITPQEQQELDLLRGNNVQVHTVYNSLQHNGLI